MIQISFAFSFVLDLFRASMCDKLRLCQVANCTRANETRPMRVDVILAASLMQWRLATRDIHGLRNDSQPGEPDFSARSIGLPGEIAGINHESDRHS